MEATRAKNIVHTNITADTLSRRDILDWIKKTLDIDVQKVEDLCSGIIYCRLMDEIFGPGTVQLKRVKFNARLENEFIHNFKVLQVAFNICGVDRAIPIEKLVKGRYNDNYDFAQWFKMFYDANVINRLQGARSRGPAETPKNRPRTSIPKLAHFDRFKFASNPIGRPATASQITDMIPTPTKSQRLNHAIGDAQEKICDLKKSINGLETSFYELTKSVHLAKEARAPMYHNEQKLTEIKRICVAEDSKGSTDPAMNSLLHQLLRILNRECTVIPTKFRDSTPSLTVCAERSPDFPTRTGTTGSERNSVNDLDLSDIESEDFYDEDEHSCAETVSTVNSGGADGQSKGLQRLDSITEEDMLIVGGDTKYNLTRDDNNNGQF